MSGIRYYHFLLALGTAAIWGSGFIFIKLALQEVPPLFLVFLRLFLTSIPLIFFIKKPIVPFKMLVFYGLTMFALQFSGIFFGIYAGVTPGLASILIQVQVFFTAVLGVLFFKEKLGIWQVVGGLIACLGIYVIIRHFGGGVTAAGFAFILGGALGWSMGNIISKKIGDIDMLSLVVWGSFIAWPPLLIASFLLEGPDKIMYSLHHINAVLIFEVLYISYVVTMLAFSVWSYLLHHCPLSKIVTFTLLVPVFSMMGSIWMFEEPLESWKIFSMLLIIGGIGIYLFGPYLMKVAVRYFTVLKK